MLNETLSAGFWVLVVVVDELLLEEDEEVLVVLVEVLCSVPSIEPMPRRVPTPELLVRSDTPAWMRMPLVERFLLHDTLPYHGCHPIQSTIIDS